MFGDSLTRATGKLLNAVKCMTEAMNEKRRVIEEAQVAITNAQMAVQEAKEALKL